MDKSIFWSSSPSSSDLFFQKLVIYSPSSLASQRKGKKNLVKSILHQPHLAFSFCFVISELAAADNDETEAGVAVN